MIVTPDEMYALEEAAFAAGATPEALMDQVGERIAWHLLRRAGSEGATVLVYAGKGNNAGDALVAAEQFCQLVRGHDKSGSRYQLRLRVVADKRSLGPLAQKKLAAIPDDVPRLSAEDVANLARHGGGERRLLILDGLLGLGARGATLREPIRSAAREINALRREHGARVVAIDTPSGIDTDSGQPAADTVIADETLAVGFAKTGLLADAATNFVGQLHVVRLAELDAAADMLADVKKEAATRGALTTSATLEGLLPPRAYDAHKGQFGRVGILAGSVGATGAAVMCSHAAVRAGAGLLTLYVHREVYPIVAAAAAPEVMVRPLDSPLDLLKPGSPDEPKYDVLAVGPGLGRAGDSDLRELIEKWPGPMIVDADGLNALAAAGNLDALDRAAGPRLLTPHPGEMARLRQASGVDKTKDDEKKSKPSRLEISRAFTDSRPHVTLLLKGARTLISQHGCAPAYNTTGNPGMATGGMGDVLTGICAALVGQGLAPFDAARLGAWVHGRAADFALRGSRATADGHSGESEESLAATDLFAHLGAAFRELRLAR